MKILVTGIAGFIGSHVAERLLDFGYEIIGLDNFCDYYDINLKNRNVKIVEDRGGLIIRKDLRDSDLSNFLPGDIDYIFHFAAQPGIQASSSFEDYLTNNIISTKNLIDFALSITQLKLFVNISTSSVYGLEATCAEDSSPNPASHYGVTKLAAEQLVLQKSREKLMDSCSLRLYSVYGPRERPEKMYSKLIACGFNNEEFPLFEGSEKHLRSFTYIDDIVDGVVSVIDNENVVKGQIINLGTELEHTTKQGIEAVEHVLRKKIKIKIVPKRAGDQLRTRANIDKARLLLNYNPNTTLLEGVKKQVSWYKRNFID